MKKLIIILISAMACTVLQAQSPKASFDRMELIVSDLAKSVEFYTKALGFAKMKDAEGNELPDKLENEAGRQIHLIQGDIPEQEKTKSVHIIFSITALHPFTSNLNTLGIPYENQEGEPGKVTIGSRGVRHIYFQDPDGYWIEVNDKID